MKEKKEFEYLDHTFKWATAWDYAVTQCYTCIQVANPPAENCGICNYRLADGYRCGGGTHYVCMGCIDAYKTTYTK